MKMLRIFEVFSTCSRITRGFAYEVCSTETGRLFHIPGHGPHIGVESILGITICVDKDMVWKYYTGRERCHFAPRGPDADSVYPMPGESLYDSRERKVLKRVLNLECMSSLSSDELIQVATDVKYEDRLGVVHRARQELNRRLEFGEKLDLTFGE